jgi:hypothetical protein
VALAALILFMRMFMFVANILRNLAKDARDGVYDEAEASPDDAEVAGMPRAEALARLEKMRSPAFERRRPRTVNLDRQGSLRRGQSPPLRGDLSTPGSARGACATPGATIAHGPRSAP